MAEKIKFCRKCGAPRNEGAKFCKKCGYQFETEAAKNLSGVAQIAKQAGAAVSAPVVAQVAKQAGAAVNVPGVAEIAKQAGTAVNASGVSQIVGQASAAVNASGVSEIALQAGQMLNLPEISALAQPGEFALDDFIMGNLDEVVGSKVSGTVKSVTDKINAIKSPLSTALGGAGSILTGIFKAFKQPKVLLTSAIMAVLWIVLGTQRYSDSEVVNILSFLTFSEGGFDREGLGTLGGIAGKGAVAVMFGSLLSGGIPKLVSGIGSLFKKTEGKKSIVALLVGIILGIVIYFAFTGFDLASAATAMAGISGAALSLEALGGKSGWIYQMAASLTAKKVDGVRTLQDGKINSLLGGLTAGFAIVTAVTSMW